MNFNGKVAVVTGAASGIGAAVALGFAARGGAVIVADYNEDGARAVVQRITAAGGRWPCAPTSPRRRTCSA